MSNITLEEMELEALGQCCDGVDDNDIGDTDEDSIDESQIMEDSDSATSDINTAESMSMILAMKMSMEAAYDPGELVMVDGKAHIVFKNKKEEGTLAKIKNFVLEIISRIYSAILSFMNFVKGIFRKILNIGKPKTPPTFVQKHKKKIIAGLVATIGVGAAAVVVDGHLRGKNYDKVMNGGNSIRFDEAESFFHKASKSLNDLQREFEILSKSDNPSEEKLKELLGLIAFMEQAKAKYRADMDVHAKNWKGEMDKGFDGLIDTVLHFDYKGSFNRISRLITEAKQGNSYAKTVKECNNEALLNISSKIAKLKSAITSDLMKACKDNIKYVTQLVSFGKKLDKVADDIGKGEGENV